MISCKDIVAKATDYLEKQLSYPERMQYFLHLLLCPHCKRFFKQMQLMLLSVASLPVKEKISPALEEKLIAEFRKK